MIHGAMKNKLFDTLKGAVALNNAIALSFKRLKSGMGRIFYAKKQKPDFEKSG